MHWNRVLLPALICSLTSFAQPQELVAFRNPGEAPPASRSLVAGQSLAALARLVGKTVVGMRAEANIRGVDHLVTRPDVDRGRPVALSPRPVTVLNPADALGASLPIREFRELYRYALDCDVSLGRAGRLRFAQRGRQDALRSNLR